MNLYRWIAVLALLGSLVRWPEELRQLPARRGNKKWEQGNQKVIRNTA
jgi:hypothetical protein